MGKMTGGLGIGVMCEKAHDERGVRRGYHVGMVRGGDEWWARGVGGAGTACRAPTGNDGASGSGSFALFSPFGKSVRMRDSIGNFREL